MKTSKAVVKEIFEALVNLTDSKVVQIVPALTYGLARNIQRLKPLFVEFTKEITLLRDTYGMKDKNGQFVPDTDGKSIKSAKKDEWLDKLEQLRNEEVEFEPYYVGWSLFEKGIEDLKRFNKVEEAQINPTFIEHLLDIIIIEDEPRNINKTGNGEQVKTDLLKSVKKN